ncbi:DUF3782 domain-containing protein [uncultured Thiocystis sp.]|jgi:hypothetical protein|uniref:DUF3782 domain-containing protein n=1 Tax=uncultured Thiocystis sp. TaxID=1202134 RepID=UPI0025F55E2F|nr:DUF3782 domain-containing protein [uncultured Thiocystis sp.]
MASTTLEEVRSLFREVAEQFKESDRKFRESTQESDRKFRESTQETDRKFQETDRKFQESNQETNRKFQEVSREFEVSAKRFKQTERMIKEIGCQIGGIGDKFGYFTEGMALPSMERILAKRFGMTVVMPRVRIRKGGETIEIDVLSYANGDVNLAVVVEVKSRVKKDSILQFRNIMERFREFFPEHGNKTVLGILAGVDWDRGTEEEARDAGFLTASIHDEIFKLTTASDFVPKRWGEG